MKNLENLHDLFDIDPVMEQTSALATIPAPVIGNSNKETDQEEDYQLARNTLRTLIIQGGDTLENLIELSKNSETPRHYEVAGQFIKTLSDVSKDLLALQKQVKELDKDKPAGHGHIGTQNNVVFAGSTAELMKFLGNKNDSISIDQ